MKRCLLKVSFALVVMFFLVSASAIGADIDLAKKSTLEYILKKGELCVGFDSGYMPFEMTDQKGRYVGFSHFVYDQLG